jgi:hypothetical protein
VENARRFHADKVSAMETKPVWPPLHAALGMSDVQLQPSRRRSRERDATLVLAEDVLRRLAQHEGVRW